MEEDICHTYTQIISIKQIYEPTRKRLKVSIKNEQRGTEETAQQLRSLTTAGHGGAHL